MRDVQSANSVSPIDRASDLNHDCHGAETGALPKTLHIRVATTDDFAGRVLDQIRVSDKSTLAIATGLAMSVRRRAVLVMVG